MSYLHLLSCHVPRLHLHAVAGCVHSSVWRELLWM